MVYNNGRKQRGEESAENRVINFCTFPLIKHRILPDSYLFLLFLQLTSDQIMKVESRLVLQKEVREGCQNSGNVFK